jgi:predicted RNase H-like nuclease (RuvC/YqgF family)
MDKIRDYVIDAYPHDEEIETIITKDLESAGLNENYARFRNKNAKKNGPEQLHTAIKEIKKKLQEVDRLLEYTQRLKSEITEGREGFKYKVHTERALEQVTETIKQLYIKNKKLK